MMDNYMISFSGGRTSAFMCNELLKDAKYQGDNVVICFANTGKEEPETLDFVHQCDVQLFGGRVVWLEYCPENKFKVVTYETASRKGEPYAALIAKRKFCPNVVTRFCTQELKIRPIKNYLLSLGWQYWENIVGIRYDEPLRYSTVRKAIERERWDNYYPLVEWKITKPMVLDFWQNMPFDLQLKDYQGNCDLCMLKGMYKKMQIIREAPHKADWWIEQEKITGVTFHKGYSYAQLIRKVNEQPELFTLDNDIDCFCNID